MKKEAQAGAAGEEGAISKRFGRKKNKKGGDDDESPIRTRVREFVEGKYVTVLMSMVTIFALFGDDLRLWFTTKEADFYFYGGLSLSFVLFTLEIFINSCVIDDFKYSFFFWLDIIATLSLINDIGWVIDFILILILQTPNTESVDVIAGQSSGGSSNNRAAKIIKSVRLIRLIRIIKLYKYAVKSNAEVEEAKLREQQKLSQNAQQAALKREMEPSRLGKALSDTTTRRVIIGVLGMLMVLPLLTYSNSDYSSEYGLRQLFWFGRSDCSNKNGTFYCNYGDWVTQEGWHEKLRQFVTAARGVETDELQRSILWLYIPDYNDNGTMNHIVSIPNQNGSGVFWQEDEECGDFVISSKDCWLRTSEMELVSYTPAQCSNGEFENCNQLVAYVRFNTRNENIQNAQLQFATTIFTCFILTVASLTFSNDTEKIVIVPITKMVGIIKTLADDPLQKPEPPKISEDDLNGKNLKNHMRTVELEKTIFRIGNLLQMSFGQLGAVIIRENVSSGDGSLEIMIPGHRINVIFMVVKIGDFVEISDTLQEHTTIFLNKIIKILHVCADKWSGSANKNDGDKYLLTWKLPDIEEAENEKNEQQLELRTEYADKSLIAAVKIVSEIRRASELASFAKKPEIQKRFNTSQYKINLTFGIHMGWTIEGAIGSESKIDACYLSPHLQIAYRIEELCHYYEMQILLTESIYNLMSLKARNTLRKIDVITMAESKEPKGLYTFDLSFNNQEQMMIPDDHECGDLIKLQQYESINIESFKNKGVDYMFTLDSDIVGLQQHIQEFNPIFRQAFKCYIAGDWATAYENIERCLELWENDGPTKALQLFMSYFQFVVPDTWNGFRDIDDKLNYEELNKQFEEEQQQEDEGNANGSQHNVPLRNIESQQTNLTSQKGL